MNHVFDIKVNGKTETVEISNDEYLSYLEKRKCIMFYTDRLKSLEAFKLTDEQFGQVLVKCVQLRLYGEIPDQTNDSLVDGCVSLLSQPFKDDDDKYVMRCISGKMRGYLGGRPKKEDSSNDNNSYSFNPEDDEELPFS